MSFETQNLLPSESSAAEEDQTDAVQMRRDDSQSPFFEAEERSSSHPPSDNVPHQVIEERDAALRFTNNPVMLPPSIWAQTEACESYLALLKSHAQPQTEDIESKLHQKVVREDFNSNATMVTRMPWSGEMLERWQLQEELERLQAELHAEKVARARERFEHAAERALAFRQVAEEGERKALAAKEAADVAAREALGAKEAAGQAELHAVLAGNILGHLMSGDPVAGESL
ncbi:hypothetical protein HDV00_010809 [Rhizophlyctis rosea]|nr:hypothetical protein HDV00_010809 [Rhizophlyctis rosea]